jgi:hypothetical protein
MEYPRQRHGVDTSCMLTFMGQYTRRNAARRLGIDEKTLDTWAKRAGVEPSYDQFDSHLRLYSDEQLAIITEVRGNYWALRHDAPQAQIPSPPPKRILPPPVTPDLPHSAPERHSERLRPSRRYSSKPPLPDGWISFEEAWELTGIAGNWDKSQVDKAQWCHPGPFLRDRATIQWALSPEQQDAFFAHFGRG